jgi:hypothetical protein
MLSELRYEAECLQLNTCPDCCITLEAWNVQRQISR